MGVCNTLKTLRLSRIVRELTKDLLNGGNSVKKFVVAQED
jgi:hypothetical protein